MPDQSSKPKRPRDINQLAAALVAEATGQTPPAEPVDSIKAAAAALGRLGGLKGGKARAAVLTKKQRVEAAKKAAKARWNPDS